MPDILYKTVNANTDNGKILKMDNNGIAIPGVDGNSLITYTTAVNFSNTAGSGNNFNTTFTVPAGVTRLTAYVWGGGGGSLQSDQTAVGNVYGGGGGGGHAIATLIVTPGEVLDIQVGAGGGFRTSTSTQVDGGESFIKRGATFLARATGGETSGTTASNYIRGFGGIGPVGNVSYRGEDGDATQIFIDPDQPNSGFNFKKSDGTLNSTNPTNILWGKGGRGANGGNGGYQYGNGANLIYTPPAGIGGGAGASGTTINGTAGNPGYITILY